MASGGGRTARRAKRRAARALVFACLCVVGLGLLGASVEGELRPTSLQIKRTPSGQGAEMLREHFGDSSPFVVLLTGPTREMDRQGPDLVRTLRGVPETSVLSPWEQSGFRSLRPSPRRAIVLVDFHADANTAVDESVPRLDRLLETHVRPPVHARQTGFATLSRAIQQESIDSTRDAELLAVPILLLVLLLVFRSPVAAGIPLILGGAAVLSTRGLLALVANEVAIDGFSLTVTSMMGLALGVDYSLLMVSRFREELADGKTPLEAAARSRRTAGTTAAFAGSTLVLAMAVTLWIMPGNLFLSLAGTAILVTLTSVALAVFVAPPLLFLLGSRLESWRLPLGSGGRRATGIMRSVLARPRLTAVAVGGALLLFAIPVLGLRTGPPSAAQLPASDAARQDAEAVNRLAGSGWDAPFVLVADSPRGPITTGTRLASLRRTQEQIAGDRAVQAVIGPAQIKQRVAALQEQGKALLGEEGDFDPAKVNRLGEKLVGAAGAAEALRGGIDKGAAGASLLSAGSERAGAGAASIAGGLDSAVSGADRAGRALERLDRGSQKLAAGQDRAALASRALRNELSGLLPVLRQAGLARARRLRSDLQKAAARNPGLAGELRASAQLVEALAIARNQAKRARATASRLQAGQATLAEGGGRLHEGVSRLARAAEPLTTGLERLGSGAVSLARGLEALSGGADSLSGHLAGGYRRSEPLPRGLDRAGSQVIDRGEQLSRQIRELRRSSPRIFDTGAFVLSALEGSPSTARLRAGELIDLRHGGQAAKLVVIPRFTFNTKGSAALGDRLDRYAAGLTRFSDLEVGVTGGAAELDDYSGAISSRIPWVVAAITLATFLVLVLVLRAVPLAAIAVLLNLLTVAIAFAVLTLLFHLPSGWPLGGHDYVDAIGAAGIFGIVFGLSIDYAVFLLLRMRECREAGANNTAAVFTGLQRTAAVITGAAAIMVAVFAVFAAAPIATVGQLGTGLAVAVILDATVVRLVLLPALMLWLGERVWWMPSILERTLPSPRLHAT